jgi:hypothetical protein
METAKRRIAGAVFVLVSIINLAAAYMWTRTGDIQRTGWGSSCRPAV